MAGVVIARAVAPVVLVALLVLPVAACGRASEAPDASRPQPDGAITVFDTDVDWLCDDTEVAFGSDPLNPDTDGDGVPDGVEVRHGFDWSDPEVPARNHRTLLRAAPGATVDQTVFVVVDGAGEAFVGEVEVHTPLEPDWPSARTYFRGATAVSAEPPENVFGFPDDGGGFGAVIGRTRLGVRLSFAFTDDAPRDCVQAVAYSYAIKRQDGARLGQQRLLLTVSPDTAPNVPWCPRTTCL